MPATTTRPAWSDVSVVVAAARPVEEVVAALGTTAAGLGGDDSAARLAVVGPNAVRTHRVRAVRVLASQLRSPLLLLLAATAAVSAVLGQTSDAVIIGVILAASVGLGFVNEFRAQRAAEALHGRLRHTATVRRAGHAQVVDVAALVPGDVVDLAMGEVVPADLRLLEVSGLECDESVLTGESMPAVKQVDAVPEGTTESALASCVLMGTIVRAGAGRGVVVATGSAAEFGRLALSLGEREPETEFQRGLRQFSGLLVKVAAALTVGIFVVNLALHRPVLDAVLFSLAIAVGISPQLLPAVVSTSLAVGSRELARKHVLVKRLVCIEDLGDVEVLFTDKTGTLTDGRIRFMRSLDASGLPSDVPFVPGLLCSEAVIEDGVAVSGNALDVALWQSPEATAHAGEAARWAKTSTTPFDHVTRTVSVSLTDPDGGRWTVVKGAPESVLPTCTELPSGAQERLDAEFAVGNRVVAVARGPVGSSRRDLLGFLVFLDPPKPDAREALTRLADLGIALKVVTGDNGVVAQRVCDELGLAVLGTLDGAQLDAMDDDALTAALPTTTVFARVTPEQKARIVRTQRRAGLSSAFLGDGVNDAAALHAADVGISVDSAADVAKDAADVILLEKDLGVLADGVVEGRRVFANTVKYVLMGTSSNFGNMFSAAIASAFLPFLPMLPSQILLNNLLYDTGQLAIPTDEVDADQLRRPSHWDIGMIRRFMLVFGPISSAFDLATFAVMLWGLHASVPEFRAGWFVESLATQTLVIFAVRTRRVPFFRSRPSRALLLSSLSVVLVGVLIPASPLAAPLGFAPLPWTFLLTVAVFVVVYLAVVDVAKGWFFRRFLASAAARERRAGRRVHRRAARFSTPTPLAHG